MGCPFLGNNLFDNQLYSTLSEIASSPKRESFILMDRIHSPAIPNAAIKSGGTDAIEHDLIPEVGIYGVFIRLDITDYIIYMND